MVPGNRSSLCAPRPASQSAPDRRSPAPVRRSSHATSSGPHSVIPATSWPSPPEPNNPDAPSSNCAFEAITTGRMHRHGSASSASIFSRLIAAEAAAPEPSTAVDVGVLLTRACLLAQQSAAILACRSKTRKSRSTLTARLTQPPLSVSSIGRWRARRVRSQPAEYSRSASSKTWRR